MSAGATSRLDARSSSSKLVVLVPLELSLKTTTSVKATRASLIIFFAVNEMATGMHNVHIITSLTIFGLV